MNEKINDGMNAKERYNKKNMLNMSFAFNKATEQKIIDHLNAQPNKSGYIKKLVLEDMQKNKCNVPVKKTFKTSEIGEYNSLDGIRFGLADDPEETNEIPNDLVSYNELVEFLRTQGPKRVMIYFTAFENEDKELEEIQNLGYEII